MSFTPEILQAAAVKGLKRLQKDQHISVSCVSGRAVTNQIKWTDSACKQVGREGGGRERVRVPAGVCMSTALPACLLACLPVHLIVHKR